MPLSTFIRPSRELRAPEIASACLNRPRSRPRPAAWRVLRAPDSCQASTNAVISQITGEIRVSSDLADGNNYRAVYTVRFAGAIYVLHAFQKKSTKGVATPRKEIETIKLRLAEAGRHHEADFGARDTG